ncbi:MAG: hypothetical protein ACK5LU_02760, partial [Pseudanabaena sp.]
FMGAMWLVFCKLLIIGFGRSHSLTYSCCNFAYGKMKTAISSLGLLAVKRESTNLDKLPYLRRLENLFAAHAEFNTGTPDNSFIIFGNGDKLRLN